MRLNLVFIAQYNIDNIFIDNAINRSPHLMKKQ